MPICWTGKACFGVCADGALACWGVLAGGRGSGGFVAVGRLGFRGLLFGGAWARGVRPHLRKPVGGALFGLLGPGPRGVSRQQRGHRSAHADPGRRALPGRWRNGGGLRPARWPGFDRFRQCRAFAYRGVSAGGRAGGRCPTLREGLDSSSFAGSGSACPPGASVVGYGRAGRQCSSTVGSVVLDTGGGGSGGDDRQVPLSGARRPRHPGCQLL